MSKRILDVGNCSLDHGTIRRFLQQHFEAEVVQAHDLEEALDRLRSAPFDLVLVNRLLDRDGSPGLEVVKAIKRDSQLSHVPVMLISNLDQYQQEAMEHGAMRGFGKAQLDAPGTLELLAAVLR